MNKRLFLALVALIVAGGFQMVRAQQAQHAQTAKDLPSTIHVDPGYKGPPFFTYKGVYYGFLTDSKDMRLGSKATPEQVRAGVANGGRYLLGGKEVQPAEEAAKWAGQWVKITALYTSNAYGTGPTSDPSIEGLSAGEGTMFTKYPVIKIISVVAATPPNDTTEATTVNADTISPDTVGKDYATK